VLILDICSLLYKIHKDHGYFYDESTNKRQSEVVEGGRKRESGIDEFRAIMDQNASGMSEYG
jgi:hypothetical protein